VNAKRVVYKSDDDESIKEEVYTKSRNQKKESKSLPKVRGLMYVSDSDDEKPLSKDEALAQQDEAMTELFDNVSKDDEPAKIKVPSRWKTTVKGLLHWDSDSDIEVDEEEDVPRKYAFTRTNLRLGELDNNTSSHESTEGIVGEQEVDSSALTSGGSDRRRLIDGFYAQEGVHTFPDSDDEAESEQQAKPTVEESKVMTQSD